jgi:hypothetical protein
MIKTRDFFSKFAQKEQKVAVLFGWRIKILLYVAMFSVAYLLPGYLISRLFDSVLHTKITFSC